ncbi:uncharacterized protein RSE6_06844 [Rhynchosporium secalis]|uniref:Tryptophanyl-tRNA synthetase n=1 Tax=Rhynchosporium secalis TaxID=38038 RepID=A0A1E1MBK2_RHYSE|nr:uncharacterized protein RSE6_06844 [Rhynchosporium secalis]
MEVFLDPPEHSKLSLADNISPLDESSKSKLKLGLFSYPVLQAADILVHRLSFNLVTWDPVSRPGVSNLLALLSSFDKHGRSAQELGGMLEKEGMGLGAFKKLVAGEVREGLRDVRERFERVLGEEGYVEEVARRGAVRARESAEETMVLVREAVGL